MASEDEEVRVTYKFLVELWNIDCSSMVKNRVESFKDRLLGQVHLINQEPMTFPDGLQQNTVTPTELNILVVVCVGYRVLRAEQVHHIGLV